MEKDINEVCKKIIIEHNKKLIDKLKEWLSSKNIQLICKLCDKSETNWDFQLITHTSSVDFKNKKIDYSLIKLTCENCGYIIWLDNQKIKLDSDEEDVRSA